MQRGPLAGLRVLDLSRVLAGPWATQLLADLGADVIKVERPAAGDDTRSWGPPFVTSPNGDVAEAAYFLCANRGKQSVTIDFTLPEGQRLVRDLASRCHVFVENFKVGGLAKYGLDYQSLSARNKPLVYCSITGFGQDGPYSDRPGYDFVIQGMGGLMSVTGEPGGEPLKAGVAVADIMTGLYAANAIQAALHERDRTGRGAHIDVALLDVQVATMANQAATYLATGRSPGRQGNDHPNIVPYQAFQTRDGWITVAAGNDAQFVRLCTALGAPELAADPRFRTNADRVGHRKDLIPTLQARFLTLQTSIWLEALDRWGVPAGPINTIEEVFRDPQVIARGLRLHTDHPTLGAIQLVRAPIRIRGQNPTSDRPPPMLGEHTAETLTRELGIDKAALVGLKERGVI